MSKGGGVGLRLVGRGVSCLMSRGLGGSPVQ